MNKYYLENAFELNKEYPNTFEIPSKKEIESLKVNDLVKLIFVEENDNPETMPERMWVKIMKINKDNFIGILDNYPYYIESVKYGDEIVFKIENIIDILIKNVYLYICYQLFPTAHTLRTSSKLLPTACRVKNILILYLIVCINGK